MKTKPIGIRFEQEEHDLILAFAESSGETFSSVVRKAAVEYVARKQRTYLSLADLAENSSEVDMNLAFGQFLDDFKRADNKYSLIEKEPVWNREPGRWKYDFAATAHKLAHDNGLPVPFWALDEQYIAPKPYFAFETKNPEFQDYLRKTTPREFKWHNLFLGENILTRA